MDSHRGADRRLVVGFDASPGSERALGWALRRAGAAGQVVVVNGAKPRPDRLGFAATLTSESERMATAHALVDVPFLERDDCSANVSCASQVRDATPVDALIQVAEDVGADAIVVGSRHQGALRAATGSVCAELLERSPRPVVIVP